MQTNEVHDLLRRNIGVCAAAGEWDCLSHDGAYMLAKSLVGQTKVGCKYRSGGSEVLHTLRGISGASPGICIREGESRSDCIIAFPSIIPSSDRAKCLFLFTDDGMHFLAAPGSGSQRDIAHLLPSMASL